MFDTHSSINLILNIQNIDVAYPLSPMDLFEIQMTAFPPETSRKSKITPSLFVTMLCHLILCVRDWLNETNGLAECVISPNGNIMGLVRAT